MRPAPRSPSRPRCKVGDTYLIFSEVTYKYVPTIGYVMAKAGINLTDFTFTRPRQSLCVLYGTTVCTSVCHAFSEVYRTTSSQMA